MLESSQNSPSRDRRSRWQHLRKYIAMGGWMGNVIFVFVGIFFGFYIGGFSGAKFFEELFLIDLTGPVAPILGSIVGIITGTLSIWGILVIMCAFLGALAYLAKYRSFPSPTE